MFKALTFLQKLLLVYVPVCPTLLRPRQPCSGKTAAGLHAFHSGSPQCWGCVCTEPDPWGQRRPELGHKDHLRATVKRSIIYYWGNPVDLFSSHYKLGRNPNKCGISISLLFSQTKNLKLLKDVSKHTKLTHKAHYGKLKSTNEEIKTWLVIHYNGEAHKHLNDSKLSVVLVLFVSGIFGFTELPLSFCITKRRLLKTTTRQQQKPTQPQDNLVHVKRILHIAVHQAWRINKRHQAEPFLSRRADLCAQVLWDTWGRIQKHSYSECLALR